jgi:UDP-3-O-[3-hydroxymyristoyl] N-acetylglucosamine deacetylase / 3-hydroxyacyl-[acyl-carrier-protein] dehydratase
MGVINQQTIKNEISLSGVGLHTGQHVNLLFKTAPPNHGIIFKRVDLEGHPLVHADITKVISTNRGTVLQSNDAVVSTTEHVLAAIAGCQIDNLLIELNGPEIPILDGSALHFMDALLRAGIETQPEPKEILIINEPIHYKNEVTGTEIIALPSEHFEIITLIDFNSKILGEQHAHLTKIEEFYEQIAPCRTFVFLHEVEKLFEQNLIKGGELDNAIVIAEEKVDQTYVDQLMEKMGKSKIILSEEGILNSSSLKFKNEPARHKLLDVLGDITLLGVPIQAKIIANKPGHYSNIEFTKILKNHLKEQRKNKAIPCYNPNTPAIYDSKKVEQFLPHRYPFLLVDKIIELGDNYVVGIKNVTYNEPFFTGHFPGNPIFPGVLQVEAMAQVGGILAMEISGDPGNWDTYFLKIDQCKFKQMVVPGDTLIIKMELLAPIKRGICFMKGTIFIGNKLISEAELTAQIVKRTPND